MTAWTYLQENGATAVLLLLGILIGTTAWFSHWYKNHVVNVQACAADDSRCNGWVCWTTYDDEHFRTFFIATHGKKLPAQLSWLQFNHIVQEMRLHAFRQGLAKEATRVVTDWEGAEKRIYPND